MTVLAPPNNKVMRVHVILASAFVAIGLYTAVSGNSTAFLVGWGGVLIAALVWLRSDGHRVIVFAASLLSAIVYAVGSQDKVYTFGALGIICLLSVLWLPSRHEPNTTWDFGAFRISLRPRIARIIRLALGVGLIFAAILEAVRAGI